MFCARDKAYGGQHRVEKRAFGARKNFSLFIIRNARSFADHKDAWSLYPIEKHSVARPRSVRGVCEDFNGRPQGREVFCLLGSGAGTAAACSTSDG